MRMRTRTVIVVKMYVGGVLFRGDKADCSLLRSCFCYLSLYHVLGICASMQSGVTMRRAV